MRMVRLVGTLMAAAVLAVLLGFFAGAWATSPETPVDAENSGGDVPAGWSSVIAGTAGAAGALAGAGGTVWAQRSSDKSAARREDEARRHELSIAQARQRMADIQGALEALDAVYAGFFEWDATNHGVSRLSDGNIDIGTLIRLSGSLQTAVSIVSGEEEAATAATDEVVRRLKEAITQRTSDSGDKVEEAVAKARRVLSGRLHKERRRLDDAHALASDETTGLHALRSSGELTRD